ncbi:hypothetical protein HYFRA_00002089 [Hymenoscyphus fraxineus]|uniref:Amino acid transporter n=1 Tax=Hymenoscyphus fraxineus TaxID=746836 RepID=A0A9N9KL75_9HELO|nr:hypothetical protein HYFRA_00002089 [Hymenoscyphus fraxineus]
MADQAILTAQGHQQAMPRSFSMLSALGLGFSVTNSWASYVSNFGQNLSYGGPQSVILGALVALFAQWILTLGLSELASAFPSSGGQYHFVWILSEKKKHFVAFVVGWLSVIGWCIATASGVSLATISIFGLVKFWNDGFEGGAWMVYLIFLVVIGLTFIPLYLTPRSLPLLTTISLWVSLLGFGVIFVVLVAMKKHNNPWPYLTESHLGTSGWGEPTAWILGSINSMYAFSGCDAPIHIAEEVPKPGIKIPAVMNLTMFIGALTTFPLLTLMMYAMRDMQAVITSGLPSAELIYQITESKTVTTFMMCWVILVYTSSLIGQWVTCGRLVWAFARDGGTPYKDYFIHIDTHRQFPLRATLAAVTFVSIYGLLYLASTTAFNSILTTTVFFLDLTYAIPQGILLFRGRGKTTLPDRPLDLGTWGYVVNSFSVVWTVLLAVMVCFPTRFPTEIGSMNWAAVIIVGILGVVGFLWVYVGDGFEGPKIDLRALSEANGGEKRRG